MSRQYESTSTSKNYIANTFDQFLNWQYNRSFMNCPRTIIEIDGGVADGGRQIAVKNMEHLELSLSVSLAK